jgi:hypothetical protein
VKCALTPVLFLAASAVAAQQARSPRAHRRHCCWKRLSLVAPSPRGSWESLPIGPGPFFSATSLIVTAAGSNFTGEALRLAIVYLSFGPPTS